MNTINAEREKNYQIHQLYFEKCVPPPPIERNNESTFPLTDHNNIYYKARTPPDLCEACEEDKEGQKKQRKRSKDQTKQTTNKLQRTKDKSR